MKTRAHVYVIDDDPHICQSLSMLLRSIDMESDVFLSAEEFLVNYVDDGRDATPRCLLLDVFLPGMNGVDLQVELRNRHIDLPIIIITGNSTVPLAVKAMKRGAFELLEKPFHRRRLIEGIDSAVEHDHQRRPLIMKQRSLEHRLATLTSRERDVLERLLQGKSNKKLAYELGFTSKTAAKYSSRVFTKLKIDNVVELSKLIGDSSRI